MANSAFIEAWPHLRKDTNMEARHYPVSARRSPHPVIARRRLHLVIARRAAPWQSMPSRESAMDRFDLQPSHAGSQHGQNPGFIQVERLLQHRPRKAKNRWRKRFGREIGMTSSAPLLPLPSVFNDGGQIGILRLPAQLLACEC